jgi:hypothetical protein
MAASKPDNPVSQTGPPGFYILRPEATFKDYRARDRSNTSLVSSRPHAESGEEDPVDEGAEVEGRSS